MKALAAVLLTVLSAGIVAPTVTTSGDITVNSTETSFKSTALHNDSVNISLTPDKSAFTTHAAIVKNKSLLRASQRTIPKTTSKYDDDPLLLGDAKKFLHAKDLLLQEIRTLDEETKDSVSEPIKKLKADGRRIRISFSPSTAKSTNVKNNDEKGNITESSAIKILLEAEDAPYDDLSEEEEDENDDYDDDEDEDVDIDDDEQVLTGCPDYCKCAGEYASATTATCTKLVDEQEFGTSVAHLRVENAGQITLGPHALRSRGLQHLESFMVTDTKIVELNQTAFDGVTYLFAVNLTRNGLQEIHPNIFQNNTQLTLLSITQNPLKHSQDLKSSKHGLFDAPSVTEFDYSYNGLTKLKRNAFVKMPNLIYINLKNNKLKEVDSVTFNSLESLMEVDLSNNLLNETPLDLFYNKEVQTLRIAGNNLTTLANIRASELRLLDASNNKIRIIANDDLLAMPLLEQLTISSNNIKRIHPYAFAGLDFLTYLDISNNELTSFTEHHLLGNSRLQIVLMNDNPSLGALPVFKTSTAHDGFSIIRFEAANCGLHKLHEDTFKYMPAITRLNLSRNRLTGLPNGLMGSVTSLKILDLSDNMINSLENNMFDGANNLVKINLAGNPLVTLQVTPFLGAPSLSKIDASRCALERVWSEARLPLASLKFLIVRENILRRITVEELNATPNIVGINLSHNPLDCDDEFNEAIQWLTDRGVSPMEPFRYLNNYDNGDNYQDSDGISQWTDLAKIVCQDINDGPPNRQITHKKNKVKNMLDELDTSKSSDALLRSGFEGDEDLLKLQIDHGVKSAEELEKYWKNSQTTQDQEYEDFVAEENTEYRPWYASALWPVAAIVIITVMLLFLGVHIAFYLAKRRGGGPVLRPPMILRPGLIDNKNCGLVYKPLQEEIATPHMPKRGSFYSSSTFHYDKIVPESV